MAGVLYIVATPIGNLEDLTFRALKTLQEVDLVLAENPRKTSVLLNYYQIAKPLLTYHQHSSVRVKLRIFQELIQNKKIALVCDAGLPGIADPGNELIDFLLAQEPSLMIVPLPGPSAITTALSVCGFRVDKFVFLGFWPRKKRSKLVQWLKEGGFSFAFYESPRRILATLEGLEEALGQEKRIFIARELTKIHESLYRGSILQVIKMLQKAKVKGEVVVVVEG